MNGKRKTRGWLSRIEHWQMIAVLLAIYDFVAVCAAYFLALLVRFDMTYSAIDGQYLSTYGAFIFPAAAGSVLSFCSFACIRACGALPASRS